MIIHLCPLAALDDTLRNRYRDTLLSADEQARLTQFKRPQAADQFLAGRALLRTTLGELLGRAPPSLQIERSPAGKPNVRNNDGWHFNLSHSSDWVALALSRDGEVGIDIENSTRGNNLDGIAERFFRTEESAWLQSLPTAERRQHFYQLWTLKEATVKALGTGIAGVLGEVGVSVDNETIALTLHGDFARVPAPLCWHTSIDTTSIHTAVVLLPDTATITALQPKLLETVPLQSSSTLAVG